MALPPVETSQEHLRRALLLLEELEDHMRVTAFGPLARDDQVVLVAAARRRLWLARASLGPSDSHRHRFLRKLVLVGSVMFKAAVLAAFGAAFLLRSVWRCVRGVLRLVFTLRAIWP